MVGCHSQRQTSWLSTSVPSDMLTYKVILEDLSVEGKYEFHTIEECVDMSDCIQFIHDTFPGYAIQQITEYVE